VRWSSVQKKDRKLRVSACSRKCLAAGPSARTFRIRMRGTEGWGGSAKLGESPWQNKVVRCTRVHARVESSESYAY
jgi:hypothetical protein